MTAATYQDIKYGADRGIATITLDRPEKLNALRVQTYDELLQSLREAGADETVGVVVVRGAGRAFCAGGDIEMAQSVLTSEAAGRTHFFERMIGVSDVIVGLGKPVVFSIHGAVRRRRRRHRPSSPTSCSSTRPHSSSITARRSAAATGGERRNSSPSWSACAAPRRFSFSRRESMRRKQPRWVVTRVVPAGTLEEATAEVCERLLDLSEEGIRLTKAALRPTMQLLLSSQAAAAELNVAAMGRPDLHAAFDAFLAGRAMSWRALSARSRRRVGRTVTPSVP